VKSFLWNRFRLCLG